MNQAEFAAFGAAADVAQLIGTVSIALAVEGDAQLREMLRQSARSPSDQALILQLPGVSAALVIEPDGVLRPLRTSQTTGAPRLEALVAQHPQLRLRLADASTKTQPQAQTLFEAFFVPGSLPSRSAFCAVWRWRPLIEATAYQFATRASARLDGWRASALREATSEAAPPETVVSFYFALNHTMAHLTLLSSELGAGAWLAEMARSFEWINWTPSFPLVRERTLWLAAAAAKSAAAFGPDVIDSYLRVVTQSRHAYKVFDALFGLASIALAHDHVLPTIRNAISAAQDASVSRLTAGAEQAPWMFRSVTSMLQRWADDRSADPAALRQLGWDPDTGSGLATRQAFRLDPSAIDARGEVLGFGALPAIMQAAPGLHYPSGFTRQSPLLPRRHELAGILTRAWGASPRVRQTVH